MLSLSSWLHLHVPVTRNMPLPPESHLNPARCNLASCQSTPELPSTVDVCTPHIMQYIGGKHIPPTMLGHPMID